ncbi:MAG: metallophosphoesterase [Desulfobacterales bacterium]|nr:metallophosphoesterase [Desulfobacterales bacterium]
MGAIHTLGRSHNLRILALSDYIDKALTRDVEKKALPPIDLVISCGDMEPEYLSFLRDRLDCPLFYVKGNHDIRYTRSNPMGCDNIHARVVTVGSFNILGLEGSMWYNGGPNQYTDAMMRKILFWMGFRIWRKRPIHMVVSHAAPRHIHDREDLCHMGFESFNRLIAKQNPDYFIHGHVHEAFDEFEERITRINRTQVINTCGHMIIEV